ncbi:ShlB/FhaC/HecB family hemolysin secretion/activation protein [Pseudomaricurvus sp. HS19]|uniref:ShlB/FhaC/HecB family hemolysin secretion/activation protein n=1 Tax=Pseudomaricurvus sp. HS19 TaxID=2692626 RepID=UPI00136DA4A8|nr:ShlB/FhaC/HecB family hemolysin secretion/activation protein [Pseudomaricurvus sp. HS19]MYM62679.1 BamA/TamA family outer membrane protein [Pseudomaricurvus sp. HS19]
MIRKTLGAASLAGLLAIGSLSSRADLLNRPADERPTLPSFESGTGEQILPPVTIPDSDNLEGIAAGRTVYIRDYQFSGNQVFPLEKLQAIAADFRSRQVSFADLERLRTTITQAYIAAGMVNSGALIPDQEVAGGVVRVLIVEGYLAEVSAHTDGRLRTAPIEQQILRAGTPLNVFALEEELQLLQQDPRIERFQAQLLPGDTPGEARLDLGIEEARPWQFNITLANDEPVAIGEEALTLGFMHYNLLGFSDELGIWATKTEGLEKADAFYRIPINSYGTTVGVAWSESHSEVVPKPFDALQIEGESSTFTGEVQHPLWRHPDSTMRLFLKAEARRSYTSLLGFGFTFTPGPEEGLARARVVRIGQDYTHRSPQRVLALRTTLSTGLDVDNATIHDDDDIPDGEFLSALVQFQLAQRMALFDSTLIGRLDAQWSDSPLLGMEQLAIGGKRTVRGYVENGLVADNGVIASLEWRIPVWRSGDGSSTLQFAPFADYGQGWNSAGEDPVDDQLASIGAGLLFSSGHRYRAEVWYGEALEEMTSEPIDSSLQEQGWHLSLSVTLP